MALAGKRLSNVKMTGETPEVRSDKRKQQWQKYQQWQQWQ